MNRDKKFYGSFFAMTAMISLQNLLTFAVNLADNVMIGGYRQDALSGVALVNQIQFLLQMMMTGVGNGLVVLGSQYWGKGENRPIRKITASALLLAAALSLLLTGAALAFPRQLLGLLTDEPAVIDQAAQYLKIVCFSYLLFGITNILLAALRAVETVRIGFAVTLTALFTNVLLNYLLIGGKLGFPELGIRGAAVATLVSRILEFSIVVVYVLCFDKKIRWRPKDLLRPDGGLFRDYLHVGLPVILSSTIWGVAMGAQTAILGRLGSDTIAANSIATTLFQVVSVVAYGSASATSVLIGKAVGEGDPVRVKHFAHTLQLIFLAIGLVTGAVFWLSRNFILSLYSINEETYGLATQFIWILSITVIGTSYQVACLTGIVTGGGDTKFVLINDLIFQWLIVLPSAFLSAFVFHAPLWVTFACLKADQILKCIVAFVKVNCCSWMRVLTRDPAARS